MVETTKRTVSRRKVLQTVTAASAASLAGCPAIFGDGGDDGDGGDGGDGQSSGNLGERVPTVVVGFISDHGAFTTVYEAKIPSFTGPLEELGVETTVDPYQLAIVAEIWGGTDFTYDFPFAAATPTPQRLDPSGLISRYAVENLAIGGRNLANWWSGGCEYSDLAQEQNSAPNEEVRQEAVTEALQIFSSEYALIETVNVLLFSVSNTDAIDPGPTGIGGMTMYNPEFYIDSSPKNKERMNIVVEAGGTETQNYHVLNDQRAIMMWNNLVHSPLLGFDENMEIREVLAESYEVVNDGRKIVFELADGTFHNGDPITAEDAKFSFEWLVENSDNFPMYRGQPFDSFTAVDDKTFEVTFTEPSLPALPLIFAYWGVWSKDVFESSGAVDSPTSFTMDPIVGSGPFEVVSHEPGVSIIMDPHDGHPAYSPDHGLNALAFSGEEAIASAFTNGEIDVTGQISSGIYQDLLDEPYAEGAPLSGHTAFPILTQHPTPPNKFKEFRQAAGMVPNRREMNDLAMYGEATMEPYSLPQMSINHPWVQEDELTAYTDDMTGDVEGARQVLEDAGWGWDSNGRLHYPPDYDLEPKWPEGEQPNWDEFGMDCLDSEGNYIPPDER